jgi:hypothetical protein
MTILKVLGQQELALATSAVVQADRQVYRQTDPVS